MHYVAVACRILIGVVFVVAVVGKLSSGAAFRDFVESLRRMKVVAPASVRPLAAASVTAEVAIVVLIFTPLWTAGRIGLVLAAAVLAVFAGAIALSLRRGNTEPCRCFGRSAAPLGWHHVARNGFLFAVAVLGALAPAEQVEPVGLIAPAAAGALVAVLVIMLDDIVYLFKPAGGK